VLAVTGSGIEDVLNGIASVLWPLVVLLAIALFRPELRGALRRIRELTIFGNSFKFDDELTELKTDTVKLASSPIEPIETEVPDATGAPITASGAGVMGLSGVAVGVVTPPPSPPQQPLGDLDAEIQDTLTISATSPRAALMQLSAQLERLLRRIVAMSGHLGEMRHRAGLSDLVDVLDNSGAMPTGSIEALRTFARIRNEVVHGNTSATDTEIVRAIDSGIILLRTLHAIPLEINVVEFPGVTIYADNAGLAPLPGKGLILSTTSPGGAVTTRRIFPTTRDHYAKGMTVAWEWSMENVWPPAWYRDPDTEKMTEAWSSSAEFIGRSLDEV
jgi:hypothetical protein